MGAYGGGGTAPTCTAAARATSTRTGVHAVTDGAYLYVAGYNEGFTVFDVQDPGRLLEVGGLPSTAFGGPVKDVRVRRGMAGVAALDSLFAVDVSAPSAPRIVGSYRRAAPFSASGVAIGDRYVFVAAGDAGVDVVDVSDPTHPATVGTVAGIGPAADVALAGNLLAVSSVHDGLHLVDVSRPTAPVAVAHWPTVDATYNVATDGRYAWATVRSAGVMQVDLLRPADPPIVVDVGGWPQDAVLHGGRVFLPLGFSGSPRRGSRRSRSST